MRTLAYALPRINYFGARRSGVDDAMDLIRAAGGSEGLMAKAAREVSSRKGVGAEKALLYMSKAPVRIALKIASHEETERRALEDEIVMLRHEWREAEEIASTASRLA